MKLGVRGKLFLVSLTLILATLTLTTWWLLGELGGWLGERVEHDMRARVGAARVAVERAAGGLDSAVIDPLADELGLRMGVRVTVVRADGLVLGDSEFTPERLAALGPHDDRPEVRAARGGGVGLSRRYSASVQEELHYSAAEFRRADGAGWVRIASRASELEGALRRVDLAILLAAVLGLVVAAFMSGLASHLASRPLVRLADRARALAAGTRGRAPPRGDLAGLASSFEHIASELQAAVGDLERERARAATVIESVFEGILAVDAEGQVTAANPKSMELLALRLDPVGRRFADVVFAPALEELVEAASGVEQELDLPGRQRRVCARVSPLADRQGRVLVLRDVTDLRRLEAMRRDFVANVSHELRTPLSVIRVNAEALLGGALDHPRFARRFTEAIERSARRLGRLVDELLDLSRLEAGQAGLALRPCSVADAVASALEAVLPDEPEREVVVELPGDLEVVADPDALVQVLGNLLDNALKYTPAERPVSVRGVHDAGRVRIEVVDQGPGIAPRHHPRIFERFYRVDDGRARAVGGTGLGLAIVKHLVEEMGGEVGVGLAERRGSVFWVALPAVSQPCESPREA